MKIYCILLLLVLFVGCNQHKGSHLQEEKSQTEVLLPLTSHKDVIEKFSIKHKNKFLLFAKVAGKLNPVKVLNEKWPQDTECAYNILKDEKGYIVMIMSSPVSESGDWNLECTHYFNNNGSTFIYEIKANAFSLPDDGIAYETTTTYFGSSFKLLRSVYKLVDEKGKKLNKKDYGFDALSRGLNVKAYANVNECLAAYHIKLDN
jgi:hypothetical protein